MRKLHEIPVGTREYYEVQLRHHLEHAVVDPENYDQGGMDQDIEIYRQSSDKDAYIAETVRQLRDVDPDLAEMDEGDVIDAFSTYYHLRCLIAEAADEDR